MDRTNPFLILLKVLDLSLCAGASMNAFTLFSALSKGDMFWFHFSFPSSCSFHVAFVFCCVCDWRGCVKKRGAFGGERRIYLVDILRLFRGCFLLLPSFGDRRGTSVQSATVLLVEHLEQMGA